jgi:hypothetical protein
LIEKHRSIDGITFSLSEEGRKIMSLPYKDKYVGLVTKIFQHTPFKYAFQEWISNGYITVDRAVEIMKQEQVNIQAESTYYRRAQSLIAWLKWIEKLVD